MPHQSSWPQVGPQNLPGPTIETLQYLLRAYGLDIVVDGVYGPQTRGAIEKHQADNGLGVDGVAGDETWPSLIQTVSEGSKGDAVRAAQSELTRRALPETTGLEIDGDFGPITDAATRAFQRLMASSGLPPSPVDGIIGQRTWFGLVIGFAVADV